MVAKQILENYQKNLGTSLLDTILIRGNSYDDRYKILAEYMNNYIVPLISYFEMRFKTIGARFREPKSFKTVAMVDIDFFEYDKLSLEAQKQKIDHLINEFLSFFPRITAERRGVFFDLPFLGNSKTVTMMSIMPYGKSDSLIYQEFKKSKRKLFTVYFGNQPEDTGIRCCVLFNSIASQFNELMEYDIYDSKKIHRLLANMTEEDFKNFTIKIKEIIDLLVKTIRYSNI